MHTIMKEVKSYKGTVTVNVADPKVKSVIKYIEKKREEKSNRHDSMTA